MKDFFKEYHGAIIGAVIAILILWLRIHELILGIFIIAIGIFVGNYVQQNKQDVKENKEVH